MPSTILTKVNKTPVMFKDLIDIVKKPGDQDFLSRFVAHCHPRRLCILSLPNDKIGVETGESYYEYTIFATHIKRYNSAKDQTVWYKIS